MGQDLEGPSPCEGTKRNVRLSRSKLCNWNCGLGLPEVRVRYFKKRASKLRSRAAVFQLTSAQQTCRNNCPKDEKREALELADLV